MAQLVGQRNPGGGSYHGLSATTPTPQGEQRGRRGAALAEAVAAAAHREQERAQAEERHQERLRLREAGEMERVYRALDRERAGEGRAEVEAGLFWPRSATGQDKKEL